MCDDMKHYSKLKVADLKKELKARGLNTSGNKNDLVDRLMSAVNGTPVGTYKADVSIDTDVDAEDILDHDDDDVDSGGEEIGGPDEDAVLGDEEVGAALVEDVNTGQAPAKVDSATVAEKDVVPPMTSPRRIVLKRRPSTPPLSEDGSTPSSTTTNTVGVTVSDGSKKACISVLSSAERLELRKQKFGVVSEVAKKELRAARFGITPKSPTDDVMKKRAERFGITPEMAPSSDVLKKRAERFGSSVSSLLTKAELEEKLRKRQERFGIVESEVVAAKGSVKMNNLTPAQRRKQRALRFQAQ